jgi:type II secretory pathway component GspD/PulD (secretin)
MRAGWARIGQQALLGAAILAGALVSSCGDGISYAQRADPTNSYKDYKPANHGQADIIGIGEPISARQARANATLTIKGRYDLEQVMGKIAATYNVAVRWGNGVRQNRRKDILINGLGFDEARSYIEDSYDIQIIREGERRLLILPSANEPRLAAFNPGDNVPLSSALKGLAQQCGYNLVISENKEQLANTRVSTQLKNVTCYDAFEALLNPHGLSLVNNGDFYTIGGLPQREWTLNLYEPERTEQIHVNYSSSFGSSSGSGGSSGGSGSGGSSGGGSGESSNVSGGTNDISIKYDRNLWSDLETDLNQLLLSSCNLPGAGAAEPQSQPAEAPTLLPPPVTGNGSVPKGGNPAPAAGGASTPLTFQQANAAAAGASGGSGSPSACGYVRIDRSVGMVQMRAPLAVLNEADQIIQRVADIASRRLMLEARVVAVTRDRGYSQNGKLSTGAGATNHDGTTGADTPDGVISSLASGSSVTAALTRQLAAISSGNTSLYGLSFKSPNLDVVMGLLENYGTTYELMHPVMELMDRQRATLIDGRNEKYFVIQSTSTTSTATTTSNSVDERSQFVGLQFSASAQIADSSQDLNTISLQIPITSIVKNVDIPNPNFTGAAGTSASSGQAPVVSTRLIDQQVRIRDGEIKVIGGLTRTVAVDTESGLPVVRELTGIGKLFNNENITYEQVEFVVLLQVKRLT